MSPREEFTFLRKRHVKFLKRCLQVLPSSLTSFDTSRMTVLFFALSGLDLMETVEDISSAERKQIIDWIYTLQILPQEGQYESSHCGFRGGSSLMGDSTKMPKSQSVLELDSGHIAMTYTALSSLIILGDDLSRVNKEAVLAHVASLQCSDGSFYSTLGGSENDMRFVYCAATICYILQDFSAINVDAAVTYIQNSMGYEGALGQGASLEAHGGSTYCAVAALDLMGHLKSAFSDTQHERLVRWLVLRQTDGGLQGRPNKPPDTCYTFWVGASLKLLDKLELIDKEELRQFVLSTQDPITGGLAKYPDSPPDGLHTYLGMSGLSLFGEDGLQPVNPALNISQRAHEHLLSLHKGWRNV
ncbi:geranylgeranyl transferase type-1 subunit beta [Oratosquilla oratoria]|uniref:geranylgeranyl transferase type-1 subunit beta n=1 Tax=Oratosquilla oratoria TaxID=337810 RepID=UPI003F763287